MRPSRPLFILLLLGSSAGGAAMAQKAPAPTSGTRTWTQEMRDKAEFSLYQRHDCHAALQQANAAFDRAMRHPERMDPRIPLVKARAHECRGELPQAVLAYTMHDRLDGVAAADDSELAGACVALLADGQPADSARRASLIDSLEFARGQIQEARRRNSAELFLRTGSAIEVPHARGLPAQIDMDQGRLTRNMSNEYLRVMRSAWNDPPQYMPGTLYARDARARSGDAEGRLTGALADVEAQLICLDPRR